MKMVITIVATRPPTSPLTMVTIGVSPVDYA
jgi:hypothetical protein